MINAEGESQTIRIGNVSKGLKELAKALKCPVIALSQLNRALNGKPELKNLRDSGSIEQDADVVMFLHDEDYEGERTQESLTEIIFAKQRMAAIGSTYLQPELGFSRFSDTNRLPAPKVEHEPKKYTSKRYDQ
jgi:replicative DNA helicase